MSRSQPPASVQPDEPADAATARAAMVDGLVADGIVGDPRVEAALRAVRRDVLVPNVLVDPHGLAGPVAQDRAEWLASVYANTTLFIETHDRAPRTSGTMPGLMALMLDALDLNGDEHVLEVGTGTGYTAALLCHLVGEDHVSSIDLEADLVEHATTRLASLGLHPALTVGDGGAGWPQRASFDRILGTCAVRRVPEPWLEQLRDGGRIVTPLRGGLAVLTKEAPGRAHGRFHTSPAYFMPLRCAPPSRGADAAEPEGPGTSRPTELGAFDTFYHRDARFLLDLALPDLRVGQHGPGLDALVVSDGAGSQARLHTHDGGALTVTEHGPRRLWSDVETTVAHWSEHRRPGRDRYGIAIDGERQTVWLDGPDGPTWELRS